MIQPVGNILTQLCWEMKKILDLINKHSLIIVNGAKLHVWLMCSCHHCGGGTYKWSQFSQ